MKFGRRPRASTAAGPQPEDLLARARSVVKRIAGMPNYEAYVEHLRTCHPGWPVPSEREYYELYLRQRYEGGGMRCC